MFGLSHIWCLDLAAHSTSKPLIIPTPDSATFNIWFVNNIILNRYGIHYLASMLAAVPPSETRIRDGISDMYNCVRVLVSRFVEIGHSRGIIVPPFPVIPANWHDELLIDAAILQGILLPDAVEPMKRYIEFTTQVMNTQRNYHWASLVASVSVSSEMYLSLMATTKCTVGRAGDATLASYTEVTAGREVMAAARVMRDELLKIRCGPAETTGWREEEARELSTEHLGRIKDFMAHSLL